MDKPSVDELVGRIDRLDRSLSRQRWVSGGSLLCAVAMLCVAGWLVRSGGGSPGGLATAPSRILAGSFVAVDRNGAPRAVLGLDPSGGPALELRDRGQQTRSRLGFDREGSAALELSDAKGNLHAELAASPEGKAILSFQQERDKPRCMIVDGPNGYSGVIIYR
jgi:hypothetical protein